MLLWVYLSVDTFVGVYFCVCNCVCTGVYFYKYAPVYITPLW